MPLHFINVLLFASFYLPVMWIWPWALYLFLFFIALTFFVSHFFRDPERSVPPDPDLIVSGADAADRSFSFGFRRARQPVAGRVRGEEHDLPDG